MSVDGKLKRVKFGAPGCRLLQMRPRELAGVHVDFIRLNVEMKKKIKRQEKEKKE